MRNLELPFFGKREESITELNYQEIRDLNHIYRTKDYGFNLILYKLKDPIYTQKDDSVTKRDGDESESKEIVVDL